MRHALGTAVFFGMIGVTFFGIFLTPVFYVVIRWLTKRSCPAPAAPTPPSAAARAATGVTSAAARTTATAKPPCPATAVDDAPALCTSRVQTAAAARLIPAAHGVNLFPCHRRRHRIRRPERPPMTRRTVRLGDCRFEILTSGDLFLGLGAVWIGDTRVRSGASRSAPKRQAFQACPRLPPTARRRRRRRYARVRLHASFRPAQAKLMRDHSFDPIHDTADWGRTSGAGAVGEGRLDLVLRPATDEFGGVRFAGFSYHYEYESDRVPLFFLLDRASWELDGDVTGATVVSQSSCSAPVVTFETDTAWTTEGRIHWSDDCVAQTRS